MLYGVEAGLAELAVGPVHQAVEEAVTTLAFSQEEELLWAGTASGALIGVSVPSLDTYCCARLHASPLLGLAPLGSAVVAVSASGATVHAPGGMHAAVIPVECDDDGSGAFLPDCSSCVAEPGAAGRVVVGRAGGGLVSINAATGDASQTAGAAGAGATALASGPRGLVAAGTPAGRLLFIDPRSAWATVADVACHAGPVTALDWARDLVATAGLLPSRAGFADPASAPADPVVRVWDVRALGPSRALGGAAPPPSACPRPLAGLHWAPRPSAGLAFHPAAPGTLLLASARGAVSLADAGAGVPGRILPVDTGGASLTACAICRTGDVAAFGSDGGWVHLWSAGGSPPGAALTVCGAEPLPPLPARRPAPAHPLPPGAPLAATPVHFADGDGGRPLSEGWGGDVDGRSARARPPRILPPALLASARRSDFLAALPNPEAAKFPGEGPGAAAVRVARLRHARLKVRGGGGDGGGGGGGPDGASAAASKPRAARPPRPPPSPLALARRKARTLPDGYAPLSAAPAPGASAGASARFLEVEWAAHNPTRFAGLEGGVANCYANAVLQTLIAFQPRLAGVLAATRPDTDAEFSLLDEAGALVRMLSSNPRGACAASNLLRALRSSKEAAGLGLVEGQAQRSIAGGAADIVLEANKDASLVRRAQTLTRFLLEQLHREAAARGVVGVGVGGAPSPSTTTTTSTSSESVIASTFGLPYVTRTQLLAGDRRWHDRPGRAFAVELAYPPPKARPPLPPRTGTAAGAAWAAAVAAAAADLEADEGRAAAVKAAMAPAGAGPPPSVDTPTPSAAAAAAAAAALTPAALAAGRPTFATLLARALRSEAVARAWFDEDAGYAPVRTARTPAALPAVLVVCSGLRDAPGGGGAPAAASSSSSSTAGPSRADLAWWAPRVDPHAAAAAADAMAAALAAGDPAGVAAAAAAARAAEKPWLPSAVEVTADPEGGRVSVREGGSAAELLEGGGGGAPPASSPLCAVYELTAVVAHVDDGGSASAALTSSIGGGGSDEDDEWSEDEDEDDGGGSGGGGAKAAAAVAAAAAAPGGGDPSALLPPSAADYAPPRPLPATPAAGVPVAPPTPAALRAAVPAEGHLVAHVRVPPPYLDPARGIYAPPPGLSAVERMERRERGQEADGEGDDDGGAGGGPPPTSTPPGPSWLLINDFAVTPCEAGEAARLYGSRKAPCVLCFTRVDGKGEGRGGGGDRAAASLARPPPLLTPAEFAALCAAPPLHSPPPRPPGTPPPFIPLSLEEAPQPGDLFGLDAEFVALAPPAFAPTRSGALVETRPARLGLARVSVVRGPRVRADYPPGAPPPDTPAIDDYVRPAEPVHDYLTRWSGLREGDLDPGPANAHHLTTLKASFTKLAHLAASGAVFVGHGLAQDFRMIGLAVPGRQVVDTVDLFRAGPRSRKLSLRFLSAVLLGTAIQGGEHDSVEDARAALALFAKYRQLKADGAFEGVIKEVYARGAAAGWDPTAVVGLESPAGGGGPAAEDEAGAGGAAEAALALAEGLQLG